MKPTLPIAPEPSQRAGHHAEPVAGAGFDGDERVAAVDFDFDALDDPQEPPQADATETLAAFLGWLAAGGDVAEAGRRALLLAHVSGKGAFKNDSALARKLNISRQRISQLRREIAKEFGDFAFCNPRRNLTSPQ